MHQDINSKMLNMDFKGGNIWEITDGLFTAIESTQGNAEHE